MSDSWKTRSPYGFDRKPPSTSELHKCFSERQFRGVARSQKSFIEVGDGAIARMGPLHGIDHLNVVVFNICRLPFASGKLSLKLDDRQVPTEVAIESEPGTTGAASATDSALKALKELKEMDEDDEDS